MQGFMQEHPLLISAILTHAAREHPTAEVISVREDGRVVRTDYRVLERRARALIDVLAGLGVRPGDRVATLAMNHDRHMELYYGISGAGAICNTINPRLAPDDIAYIADHAEDAVIFVDPGFVPIVEGIAPALAARLRAVVVLCAEANMPDCTLPPGIALQCYETLMAAATPVDDWPVLAENAASALCYTSGTTGRPKGVLYSHRATVLHAMMMNFADCVGLRAVDRILPAVPMFHVNAWGIPFMAPMAGAGLVLPGRDLSPEAVLRLIAEAGVTVGAGVPTVWLGLMHHLRETGAGVGTLDRILTGGAAFPRTLMADYAARGVHVAQAWGMTECSPVATFNAAKPATRALDAEARLDQQATQGRAVFGVEVRAEGDAGQPAPRDGKTPGNLVFRGPWVARGYYRQPETDVGAQGWFPTGDVGVIDAEGFVTLTDRTKDLIKSGGEWISSITLENIAMGHPDVAEAAAIAVPDVKWGERPLLIVVPKDGASPTLRTLRALYDGKVPDWWVPDRVVFADSLPHGATGKILKTELRRRYAH